MFTGDGDKHIIKIISDVILINMYWTTQAKTKNGCFFNKTKEMEMAWFVWNYYYNNLRP